MDAVRPWLYVGRYRDTRDVSLLSAKRIEAVLQLAEPVAYDAIRALYLPVEDGLPIPKPLLRQGMAFVLSAKAEGLRVLIACGAGISRSVGFAVAALKEAEGLGLLAALEEVHRRHAEALPHPAIWESLCAYYGEPVPLRAMLEVLRSA
jgi:hypothetical protein